MYTVQSSVLLGSATYTFKSSQLFVGFYQSKQGDFAAIDPEDWEGVHLDDWCTAALDFRDWLESMGLEVIASSATIDNGCAPYFWTSTRC